MGAYAMTMTPRKRQRLVGRNLSSKEDERKSEIEKQPKIGKDKDRKCMEKTKGRKTKWPKNVLSQNETYSRRNIHCTKKDRRKMRTKNWKTISTRRNNVSNLTGEPLQVRLIGGANIT